MKTTLVVMAAIAVVAGLALICGYLSCCTKGSLNDTPPIRPNDLR